MNIPTRKIIAIGDSVVYGRIDPFEGGWVSRLRKWFVPQLPLLPFGPLEVTFFHGRDLLADLSLGRVASS